MKKIFKSKLAIEIVMTSFGAILIVAGIVGATTIGTNIITTGTLTVDTDTLLVDSVTNKVGIASSTPTSQLSVGTLNATSTVSMGKFCMAAQQENGAMVYIRLTATGANGSPFATSTTSCF